MDLGYSGKLYILAFDHRGSFTKRFGVEIYAVKDGNKKVRRLTRAAGDDGMAATRSGRP